jgi:methanogenic corrinoid protein MtbC1
MQGALDILRPLLAETGRNRSAYVMGTVKGDVHDIGEPRQHHARGAGFTV